MASDAHCHPYDLKKQYPGAETERREAGVSCAASSWNREQFEFHETLAAQAAADGAAPVALCFAVHPQLPRFDEPVCRESLALLHVLAAESRLRAVGETGFDLFDREYRDTEKIQEALFAEHLALAIASGLPLVLHVRKAMHKVFAYSRELKKVPAVVFHSYSGTLREGRDLVKRGVNAYFSFGTPICLNHRQAMEACSALPADRLLTETDCPYQPLRGKPFSRWSDIRTILETAAELRNQREGARITPGELEALTDRNFRTVFGTA
ncbi:TatD family hydrolase [Breznakiella homolactica]|uniref:TatD family hydrolase n=1 Tax=Breznakiella homolactica TaxID=2798577 RepID=A0A7T7XKY5_9SPIR|nr:TatD family hydrolase [Breznakiella homolactica]QQO08304.1 TatD family hydrolase [Breznakiella homolactica]